MFRNVNAEFGTDLSIMMRWEWLDNEDGSLPSCHVFCCSVPENRLLEKGMFLESEILKYFKENVVNYDAEDLKAEFEAYQKREPSACVFNYIQRGNNDKENRMLKIPDKTQNHIFLVCVFDGKDKTCKILSCEREKEIEFEIVKPSFLSKILSKGGRRQTVKLKSSDQRKKVVVYKNGGSVFYAVLPENSDEYYFDENVNLAGMKIYYLSSLIGKSDFIGD